MKNQERLPICVDLDGTLVRSDTLWEGLSAAIRKAPGRVLRLPLDLLRGRAHAKHCLAAIAAPNFSLLPRNPELGAFVREKRAAGHPVLLVSAASEDYVRQAAAAFDCFDEAIGSSATLNLKGSAKAAHLVQRFGKGGYIYAGDARADLAVWRDSGGIVAVNASPGTVAAARRLGSPVEVLDARPTPTAAFLSLLKLIRVHQWAKNVLVAVPMLAAHRFGQPLAWVQVAVAFLSFSFMASSIYILNDFLDLEADRQHPRKQRRPLASGAVPIPMGFAASVALFMLSLVLAASSPPFLCLLLGYAGVTWAYSLALKRVPILDIFILSGLYTVRIFGGALATSVPVTHWMAAFSGFFFLGLGMAKRYVEILDASGRAEGRIKGRGYRVGDASIIAMLGICAGFASSVVLALYVSSGEVTALYRHSQMLWGLCGLEIFWISYAWLVAHRREMHDDPLVFALRDKLTYLLIAAAACFLLAAGPR